MEELLLTGGGLPDVNSQAEVDRRAASGRVTWFGPVLVLIGRSAFIITAHAVTAGILALQHRPSPWQAAAGWWTVYGTLADVGCLALIMHFTSREGLRLRGLIGKIRWRRARDFFAGAGCFAVVFWFFLLAAAPSSRLAFGSWQPYLYPGLLTARVLPGWAVIYSLSIWWLIWSPTEEITYQGYVLPRLYAVSGSLWLAVLLVSFWWALQHSFIPFILDWHYVAWRFLAFWPGCGAMVLIYLRTRRLAPLIVAHWLMDISGVLMTIKF
jgi:membrane protease YdiL (CAAX protease family)